MLAMLEFTEAEHEQVAKSTEPSWSPPDGCSTVGNSPDLGPTSEYEFQTKRISVDV
ncbi:hypothetical protein [Amycolatopsis sp. cg9]|uniref:hypothetical protein n=1 Tax=Amycolatopsis sp. cg9 TaxID=3238801 RepID=UPI003523395B